MHQRARRRKSSAWCCRDVDEVLEAAEPLPAVAVPPRVVVLFGNEAVGLSPADAAACDRRVTLPMGRGTDSLNVAAAAAVFLYHLTTAATAVQL